ncbi:MAG: two-component sensor histidine kinase, partial [Pseudonocardiaceae bacterium]
MPLRLRLAMLFALGTATVIAVAALAFVLQLRSSLDASVDSGLRARVHAVADELDSEGVLPQLGPTAQIVQIRTFDGRLLISSPAAGDQPLLDAAQRQRALTGQVSFTTRVAGVRSRLLGTTVLAGGQRVLVVVGTASDVSDAAVDRVQTALVVGGPPAVLLAGAGAWLLAGAALRPVERMRREAADISDRDTGRRLAVPSTR